MQKKKIQRPLKIIAKFLLGLFIVIAGLLVFVRSPWGQDIITTRLIRYITEKTNTIITIDRLFVTFSGNITLEGLYVEDQKKDTLVYVQHLTANIAFIPTLFKDQIVIRSLSCNTLKSRIVREVTTQKFNYDFLIDAFVPPTPPSSSDTLSSSTPITIGLVQFANFDITYKDARTGIESQLQLGELSIKSEKTDINLMEFHVNHIALLHTAIKYKQTQPFLSQNDDEKTVQPRLIVDNLHTENVTIAYQSFPDHINATAAIGTFSAKLPNIDLNNGTIEINAVALNNSDIFVERTTAEKKNNPTSTPAVSPNSFKWPSYQLEARQITLNNNTLRFQTDDQIPVYGIWNPKALAIRNLTLSIPHIAYQDKMAALKVASLSFEENSGFQLKNLSFNMHLNDTLASLEQLQIKTKQSALKGALSLHYPSANILVNAPDKTTFKLAVPDMSLALQEAFLFQPGLAENKVLDKLSEKKITGHFAAHGTMTSAQIQNSTIRWGKHAFVSTSGTIKNGMKPDSLSFRLENVNAYARNEDILKVIPGEAPDISIPESIMISGAVEGSSKHINASALIETSQGDIHVKGDYHYASPTAFKGVLKVDDLALGTLLNNEHFGLVSSQMTFSGKGDHLSTLDLDLHSSFQKLEYYNYDFATLSLHGHLKNGKGNIAVSFKDDHLNVDLNTAVMLDTTTSKINTELHLKGADLLALGITEKQLKIGAKLNADFSGTTDVFRLNATLSEGVVVYNNTPYKADAILLQSAFGKDETQIDITSDFLNASLQSNAAPDRIITAVKEHFNHYFTDSTAIAPVPDPVRLYMNLSVQTNAMLTDVFLQGITSSDTIKAVTDFDQSSHKLNTSIKIPSVTYHKNALDSLNVNIESDRSSFSINAGLAGISAGPILLKRTDLKGVFKNKELQFALSSYDEQEKILNISSEMRLKDNLLQWHIDPSTLILNKEKWSIPQDNHILIGEKTLHFNHVELRRNTQQLTLSHMIPGVEKEHIGILFDHFQVQTFTSIFNPDIPIVSGLIQGDLVMENPFDIPGITADLKVSALEVLQNPLGNLSLKATSKGLTAYDFNLAMKEGGVDLNLQGDYTTVETGAKLNLDVALNALQIKVIKEFVPTIIEDASGVLSGAVKVSGTLAEPQYNGTMSFKETKAKIAMLNARFQITDETVHLDNSGIYFNDFEIGDSDNNSFSIDGVVHTSELTNPSFDLQLNAEKFQLINAEKDDNDLIHGHASIDAAITLKGDLNLPEIKGKLRLREVTDITYTIPEATLDVQKRDGVVIFVNKAQPDAILTRREEETSAVLKGIRLDAILEIAEDAVFHIILDKKNGDHLQVAGDAALQLNIVPNGNVQLSGRYELHSGHYETSLYGLVKRRFEIDPGSTIIWNGDPTDATLDVTAIYNVETSAAPLMAAVTSGEDANIVNKYRQVLPFLVYLNVDGKLLEPALSFTLDMPEDQQGALGGSVFGRVQQLNQQQAALNRQVFSLLALNRFFPDSGNDGSNGGAIAMARNNVNNVLSGELNAFSDKIFGKAGFEVDFDLDSYTDYQGNRPQDRTQLNINAQKKLFNDRLTVSVGSAVAIDGGTPSGQEETPIIGNVSLEYLLTENGSYRLRGFRKNEFENIIDGQLIVTGFALIFNREFNSFSELFRPIDTAEEQEDSKSDKRKGNTRERTKKQ